MTYTAKSLGAFMLYLTAHNKFYIMKLIIIFAFCLILSFCSFATTWLVGPAQTYTLPSQLKLLLSDGDTIFIEGGIYSNDATKWANKNLKFIGLGTGANRTIIRYSGNIPNGKGIFVFESPGTCDNAYIENIVFDGAQISNANGGNGAAIRYQANNLRVVNCKFMNCQNGILEGHASVNSSNVIIEASEFENNGYQLANDPTYSGYEHNMYISASTDTLLVQNCYFHDPRGQANSLKTRAQRSYILYNLIDEAAGYGSWEINIAQGGLNIIMGNVIIQGPSSANHGIIGYDAALNVLEDFYFINNTVINKYQGNANFFHTAPASGINTYKIYNNIFASVSGATNSLFSGNTPLALDTSANITVSDYLTFGFRDPFNNDYSLTSTALPAINTGANAGNATTGYSLIPMNQYQSFSTALLLRSIFAGVIDIGAYEFENTTGFESENTTNSDWQVYPNPTTGTIYIGGNSMASGIVKVELYNSLGQEIFKSEIRSAQDRVIIRVPELLSGIYFVKIEANAKCLVKKLIIK